ncbi:telomerase holoenzyme est3 subunit [Pyrenophora seminiperda CCB06]|uniref:Telomerase holoenzyme est3 subunit n=1 Tax=Pyrenophora seminiperda CCB06 TaxID=1302712 RepID=A0A3M7MF33_9PLEO|nr:telomerase holoenzyme est3 subunit [Pyrenophora seminiperda CCB06]
MAVCPDAWLEETFQSQLFLGNQWQRQRYEQRASGVQIKLDRDWEGLYHDNGSCLDITNHIHPERNSTLRTNPLTVSDGLHQIVAHIRLTHTSQLAEKPPAPLLFCKGTVIAVRAYTIRHTSYGPRRDRLRFILHQVDLVGAHQDASDKDLRHLRPLQESKKIGAAVRQLDDTRAQEDFRRLAQYSEPDIPEPAMDAPRGDDDPHSPTSHTQLAFGTQLQKSGRLASNTQQKDVILGATSTQDKQRNDLLSLLNPPTRSIRSEPKTVASEDFMPTAVSKQPTASRLATSPKASSASAPPPPPRREGPEDEHIHLVSPAPTPAPAHSKERRKEVAPAAANTSQCSWMKGVIFNRETLKVPVLQKECLEKPTSWLKPEVGVQPFQDGNMPQLVLKVLNQMADEIATAKDAVNTDDESEVDPSPDSLPLPTQDNEDAASEVSWPSTPEPPQMPVEAVQSLPPDSSIEKQTSSAEHVAASQAMVSTQQSVRLDSDEEMEDFVPQALGGDLAEKEELSALNGPPSSRSERARSVVQVIETPVAKDKFTKEAISHPFPKRRSVSSSQEPYTSSTSIVQSTYDMPKTSVTAQTEQHHVSMVKDSVPVLQNANSTGKQQEVEVHERRTDNAKAKPIPLNSTQLASEDIKPETSPTIPPPTSGAIKRKLADSPNKQNRRHSKKREIKLIGDDDIMTVLRKEREKSLRRFREEHSDAMDLVVGNVDHHNERVSPRAMSPRHQSLYDDPSPMKASTTHPTSPSVSTPAKNKQPSQLLHQSLGRATETALAEDPFAKSDQNGRMTVFRSFKEAYPEYDGDAKHFKTQCAQMYKLDREDKMVPKWQWDDFIIRNRTAYKQYALDCIDQGENPEPYYRFYKDNIRDTIYTKGIVGNAKILQRALDEMGNQPTKTQPTHGRVSETTKLTTQSEQAAKKTKEPLASLSKPEPTRKSLPSTFNQPKLPAQDRINNAHIRPRHSLPARPQPRSRHSDTIARQSSSSAASGVPPPDDVPDTEVPDSTGDPYRDYFFSVQRSASWTGSTEVDDSKPWPQNLAVRPSIIDGLPPRKKVDVLDWGDVLGA